MSISEKLLRDLADNPSATLSRGGNAQSRIASRYARIDEIRRIAESITANPEFSSSGKGGVNRKLENCIINIQELEEEILEEITEISRIEHENREAIHELLDNPVYQDILVYRYCDGLLMEEVSGKLGYTFRWTQELHRRALSSLRNNAYTAVMAVSV